MSWKTPLDDKKLMCDVWIHVNNGILKRQVTELLICNCAYDPSVKFNQSQLNQPHSVMIKHLCSSLIVKRANNPIHDEPDIVSSFQPCRASVYSLPTETREFTQSRDR